MHAGTTKRMRGFLMMLQTTRGAEDYFGAIFYGLAESRDGLSPFSTIYLLRAISRTMPLRRVGRSKMMRLRLQAI